jgi:O-antigen/teichoic acid export membrane protein
MFKKFQIFKKHSKAMKYYENISWLLGEKIFRMLIGFFVNIWMARYLGPEQFGIFSYVQSFVVFFTVLTMGLDSIVVRELVKDEARGNELLGTAFWLKLISSSIIFIVLIFAVNFTSNDHSTNTMIFIVAFANIFQSFNVIDFYFQSKVMNKYIVLANMIAQLLSSILKIILILTNASLITFVWAVVLDSAILACGLIYYYALNQFSIKDWTFSFKQAKIFLKNGSFFAFTSFMAVLHLKIDQILIKEILGNEAVGQYAAVIRLSELWFFLPVIIARPLYPAIEQAKKVDEKSYFDQLQKLFDTCAILAYFIIIPTIILSHWLINILYGTQYSQASNVLIVHVCSLIFTFQRIAGEYWILAENLVYFDITKAFFGLLINIVLNIFLIKKYGIEGAAFSALVSASVWGYVAYALHNKGIKIFKMMTKSLFLVNLIKNK